VIPVAEGIPEITTRRSRSKNVFLRQEDPAVDMEGHTIMRMKSKKIANVRLNVGEGNPALGRKKTRKVGENEKVALKKKSQIGVPPNPE